MALEPATRTMYHVLLPVDEDVDLVTLVGRRRSPAGKLPMGSVSREVLLGTRQPVLFCPHDIETP